MKIGILLPLNEIGDDVGAIRTYAQAVEDLGFDYLVATDNVLAGPPPASAKIEPLILFALLAGFTRRVELVTGVVVAPSRQTLLLAKQATSLDRLSGGRLRLGLGVGWNKAEFVAMNVPFQERGTRIEEQMTVLRALWTQPTVTFQGQWHRLTDASLSPSPVQRPIPIWLGGFTEATLQRVARLGDGWIHAPSDLTDPAEYEKVHHQVTFLQDAIRAAGRSVKAVAIEAQEGISIKQGGEDAWATQAEVWRSLGATHLSVSTVKAGLTSLQAHIDILARLKDVLQV